MPNPKQMQWTDETLARFWDYVSQFPEHYFAYQFGDIMLEKLEKYFSNIRTVLDYGCGTGFLMPHLLKRGFDVTGLDFSKKSIQFVNEKFRGNPHFFGAKSIEEILNAKECFDVIFVVEVIEHLNDVHLEQTMKNIKKLLSPNGLVVFTTPNNENLPMSTVYCPACETEFHRWQHVRTWTAESLDKFLRERGFSVITCGTTDFSASLKTNRKNYLKYMAKRFLKIPPPHLYCVASLE
ncbi:class I SAM-dependent methyltransferase [Candidatus Peregrinibacteria bacterium]|nr:class I SAM-dependent methyltransferase [Candidatus Peregrinibacteria bacterium]